MPLSKKLQEFYRTTPMREGVLCWYPFEPDASVCDLSGGALNDLLKNRCKTVEESSFSADPEKKFDYIVVVDLRNFDVNTLKYFHSKLNPHGRLLIAYENPFALRYWSGKDNYVTFTGNDRRVSKAELQIRFRQAGFEGQKWYYPLTDHWFAQEIYSENYLPDEYMGQRFYPYVDANEFLKFDERPLYREVIRNGAFEFMCGAYLIEARACESDAPCPMDYIAVTSYREPKKRFATAVRNDGVVHKIPLHPDARSSMLKHVENHKNLSRLGVNVIPLQVEKNYLTMPRLPYPTLWDYWVEKLLNGTFDKNEMFVLFDRIRDDILKASEEGNCYWEMVPANCFYNEDKDELIYFDQAYCWENHSPEIAIARAIRALVYSPAFSGVPQSQTWLAELAERYGLCEKWEELSKFVDEKTSAYVFGAERNMLYEI